VAGLINYNSKREINGHDFEDEIERNPAGLKSDMRMIMDQLLTMGL
jgi:hypothetical protein